MNKGNVVTLLVLLRTLRTFGNQHRFNMAQFFERPIYGKFAHLEYWSTEFLQLVPAVARNADPSRCGTVACLAGWAALLAEADGFKIADDLTAYPIAKAWLGLTTEEAQYWFFGHWSEKTLDRVTLDQAIEFLERHVAT